MTFPLADGWSATCRATRLYGLAVLASLVGLAVTLVVTLLSVGVGVLLVPPVVALLRGLADRQRALASIERPYRPGPDGEGLGRRLKWIVDDPATWRDTLWLILEPWVGGALAATPLALMLSGLWGMASPFTWQWLNRIGGNNWYLFIPLNSTATAWLAAALGLSLFPLALWSAPHLLRLHARFTTAFLAPDPVARARHLAETRSDVLDTQAAELRRIERDLHDGAQARLVAMGMTLDAAGHLLESDPEAVRRLLGEARESSISALRELRDLVQGIHPPVLADRGLGDAVRSLAMSVPLRTEVTVELPGRLPAPVESAGYFTMSEVLTNAVKHSGASRVWIDVRHEAGLLRMSATDDGNGGAHPARGTGLHGIERRLAVFDGILAIHSPLGGPTIVTVELPCTPL